MIDVIDASVTGVVSYQAAEEAFNVFHPLTYEGAVDTEREADPLRRCIICSKARCYFHHLCMKLIIALH